MGTEVLRSHDCLNPHGHLDCRAPPHPMNHSRKKHLRSPPPSRSRPVRSKPNPIRSHPNKENAEARKPPLVLGKVTILKRGEDPNPNMKPKASPTRQSAAVDRGSDGGESSVLCSTNRLGPDPKILPNVSDLKSIYAGPAFISSPAPSSLPFPAFFMKKNDEASKSENATKGLRFLLGLDGIA